MRNSEEAIRSPSRDGAFPNSFLLLPPPVVPDASRLRDDVLYACRNSQRTVLVTAANAGLFRLFCAPHVIDEVTRHSAEWTQGSPVSQEQFLRRWMSEYLPLIRVVRSATELVELLDPDEARRIDDLLKVDPDDVPSAALALVLGAFYLSNDTRALRAVYGLKADMSEHAKWLEVLKAGGDSGELGQVFQLVVNLVTLLGCGLASAVRRLVQSAGPWSILLGLAVALGITRTSPETRRRIRSAAASTGAILIQVYAAYQEALSRFHRAFPSVPTWGELANSSHPNNVLTRGCLHTLARSPMSDRSARELARLLPHLGVAQGEARVRRTLRTNDYFFEVWRGRWQVGEAATPFMF